MSEVIALKPNGRIDRGSLAQLANEIELESFMVVCHWKDGTTTCGWPDGVTNEQLVYGSTALKHRVNHQVFEEPDAE